MIHIRRLDAISLGVNLFHPPGVKLFLPPPNYPVVHGPVVRQNQENDDEREEKLAIQMSEVDQAGAGDGLDEQSADRGEIKLGKFLRQHAKTGDFVGFEGPEIVPGEVTNDGQFG